MAIKKDLYEAYNEKRGNKSKTDRTGAKNATISGNGAGIQFKEGDVLSFEPVEGQTELDVRLNTELNDRGTYTCTAILTRKGQTVGQLVEVWPSSLGRMYPEYKMSGAGQFLPTSNEFGSEPPLGFQPNALEFWDRYLNKKLECKRVRSGNTLNFNGDRIIPRRYYEWEIKTENQQG